jgi:hypothetical protein
MLPPVKQPPWMNSSVAPEFWALFNSLPAEVQARARKQFVLWLADHGHPSLHFKKVGPYWSVRVDGSHRALGIERDGNILWFFIGAHDAYEGQI